MAGEDQARIGADVGEVSVTLNTGEVNGVEIIAAKEAQQYHYEKTIDSSDDWRFGLNPFQRMPGPATGRRHHHAAPNGYSRAAIA